MRIIRGKYRGRKIVTLRSFKARPTTDFAKEALFNIIENSAGVNFEEVSVLDLFSGTGSISFEFLSRGCKKLRSIEKNRHYSAHIEKIGTELFGDNIHCVSMDAFKYIEKHSLDYDIIFADPPFDSEKLPKIPHLLFANETLKDNSEFILEHSSNHDFSDNQHFVRKRNYGKVNFSFFAKNPENSLFR